MQGWHGNSPMSSRTQALSTFLPHYPHMSFTSIVLSQSFKVATVFPGLLYTFQEGEMDKSEGTKDSLDKLGLFIWEWVPSAVTSAKNILFRTVCHGQH